LKRHRSIGPFLVTCALFSLSCASNPPFVWYSQVPRSEWTQPSQQLVLSPGDAIDVRVYDQPNLAFDGKIRVDGHIALPFLGEVMAAGKPPLGLARELEQRFKEFIVAPRVTVNVEEVAPVTVSVLGEVGSRGTLKLPPPATMADLMAQCGGLNEFADDEAIYVLRRGTTNQRIRFTFESIIHDVGGAATFPLRTGDVVVVE
jgi:polysaccharide export outer membrane protein